MDKYGVEETTIVSTGAKFKNAGSSFRPESPEEKQYMQELADSAAVENVFRRIGAADLRRQ